MRLIVKTLLNHQVILWHLKPEGTCGVGDHSRLWVKHLGGHIVEVSRGQEPDAGAPQLVQYTPGGWTQHAAWAGELAGYLQRHPAPERTLFLHELRRRLGASPRSWVPFAHDLLALRMLLPMVQRILVTTEHRARQVTRMVRAWQLDVPVSTVAVSSNVHDADPLPHGVLRTPRDPDALVLFARNSGGVLGRELGDVVARVLLLRPATRVTLLGERRLSDDLVRVLADHGILERVRITGLLPAVRVASELQHASVGLALHDTGVSGRRGTISAMLASGVPVVTGAGEESDAWTRDCAALVLATDCGHVDTNAVADAVVELLDANNPARRAAAVAAYLQHCSWEALASVMGQPARTGARGGEDGSVGAVPWVA